MGLDALMHISDGAVWCASFAVGGTLRWLHVHTDGSLIKLILVLTYAIRAMKGRSIPGVWSPSKQRLSKNIPSRQLCPNRGPRLLTGKDAESCDKSIKMFLAPLHIGTWSLQVNAWIII